MAAEQQNKSRAKYAIRRFSQHQPRADWQDLPSFPPPGSKTQIKPKHLIVQAWMFVPDVKILVSEPYQRHRGWPVFLMVLMRSYVLLHESWKRGFNSYLPFDLLPFTKWWNPAFLLSGERKISAIRQHHLRLNPLNLKMWQAIFFLSCHTFLCTKLVKRI